METLLSVDNIGALTPRWVLSTVGDVSATPAVDADTVYFPDWARYLYAIDKLTGAMKWQTSIAAVTGIPNDMARLTPAVTDDKVIIGAQGSILIPGGGLGGKMLALPLLAYATGLWLGETLRATLFPEGSRKHKLYSGLIVFLKLKPPIPRQDFLPISTLGRLLSHLLYALYDPMSELQDNCIVYF